MRPGERDAVNDADPRDLLFGPDDEPEHGEFPDFPGQVVPEQGGGQPGVHRGGAAPELAGFTDEHPSQPQQTVAGGRHAARAELVRDRRRGRNRILAIVIVTLLVAIFVVVGVGFGPPIYHYFAGNRDYQGDGTGSVQVVVHPGDTATAIGDTLYHDGVVASVNAFTAAASNNAEAMSIQPGTYDLHRRMSGESALALLLRPSARVNTAVVVPEGATIVDIEKRLTAPACTAHSAAGTACGLGLPRGNVVHALGDVAALGVPTDYTINGKNPPSAEGFLYPATYPFDDKTSASAAVSQMISKFTDEVRSMNFTASAKSLGMTPYQELTIASIAQAEAKYPQDMPKVARVILNRLAAHRTLQIDATSAYAAKLRGLDPTTQIYADTKGPYNTYTHAGLPPTPIGNPGSDALHAAAHPAKGNWLYYVNGDAAGHLAFFHSEQAFSRAVTKCRARGWCPK